MSNEYVKWKERYEKNWCTIPQLQRLVQLNKLTREEVESIIEMKVV